MKANETKIDKFLATNETTFTIPVYQRNYDWTKTQCEQLFKDIIEASTNKKINAHFIGSIVYVHDDIYTSSGLTELTIIDGQQRLTTITLIYMALYVLAKELNKEDSFNRIYKTYLINEFASEKEKIKLKPTENNKDALNYILSNRDTKEFKGYSRIIENFEYFKSKVTKDNFEIVEQGLKKLIFVEISLDRKNDNPQRIFESLNSTGLELSQADLIRNYILMGLSSKDQEDIFKNYWEIIEKNAKQENINEVKVSDFIRDFLTLKNKEIPKKGNVYTTFKKNYPTSEINDLRNILEDIKSLSKYYNKLINPENETDVDIKRELNFINKLEISVSYPFLMKVYEDYSNGIINKKTFISVLLLIQSFIFRRFIISLPTNALNKIFMTLYDKVEKNKYLESIEVYLCTKLSGVQRFPKDEEVKNSLKEKDVYNIKSKNRNYLFEKLENYQNKEYVNLENPDITTEHIFPQKPNFKWKKELGEQEYNFIKERYLNTIANLTLSGNNGELGNKPFLEKKEMNIDQKEQGYIFSRLWLNRSLQELSKWDIEEIEKRFELISERFIKIWNRPNVTIDDTEIKNEEINIFDAEDPTGKNIEYVKFFNKKKEVKYTKDIYVEIFKELFDLDAEKIITTEIGKKIKITEEEKDLRMPYKISDKYFIESNNSNSEKFKLIKYALELFELEDELYIKYTD